MIDTNRGRSMSGRIPSRRGGEAMSKDVLGSSEQSMPPLDTDEIDRRLNGLIEASRVLAAAVDRFTSLVRRGPNDIDLV
jgi:hypothetical protein